MSPAEQHEALLLAVQNLFDYNGIAGISSTEGQKAKVPDAIQSRPAYPPKRGQSRFNNRYGYSAITAAGGPNKPTDVYSAFKEDRKKEQTRAQTTAKPTVPVGKTGGGEKPPRAPRPDCFICLGLNPPVHDNTHFERNCPHIARASQILADSNRSQASSGGAWCTGWSRRTRGSRGC